MSNTAFSYMYRDGDNYKQHRTVVFAGTPSPDKVDAAASNLDEGFYLIPSQVGLEDLQDMFDDGPTDADHPWHEPGDATLEDSLDATTAEPTDPRTVDEFLSELAAADWDEFAPGLPGEPVDA